MKTKLTLLLLLLFHAVMPVSMQGQTMLNISQRQLRASGLTIGNLPGTPLNGEIQIISDGTSSSDCTVGGGSTIAICRYNGSAWAGIGGDGGLLTVDISDDSNLAVSAPIVLTDDTVSFDNDDLLLTGNLGLSDATNPILSVSDSTGPTTSILAATNSVGQSGTTTDHSFQLIANSVPRIIIESDDDLQFGSGLEASMTWDFNLLSGDVNLTASANKFTFSDDVDITGDTLMIAHSGTPNLTLFDTSSVDTLVLNTANGTGALNHSGPFSIQVNSNSVLAFTATEDMTWGSNGQADLTLSFDVSGTDHSWAVSSALNTFTAAINTPYIEFTAASAPGTPASGDMRIYAKPGTPEELCVKDDAGTETCGLGGGGGVSDVRIPLLGGSAIPDAGGNVYLDILSNHSTNIVFKHQVAVFIKSSEKDCLHFVSYVPEYYSSSPSFYLVWTTPATSGNVVWDLEYLNRGGNDTESLDQGNEVLSEPSFSTHANWTGTGDATDTGGFCRHTHSSGTGQCAQASGNFATAAVGSSTYRLLYTISSASGDAAFQISTAFAASAQTLSTTNGRHELIFTSAVSPGDFELDSTSTSGAITIDDLTLIQLEQEFLTVTDAAPSAAWERLEVELIPTAGNFAAGDTMQGKVCRDGLDASNTLNDEAYVVEAFFEFN